MFHNTLLIMKQKIKYSVYAAVNCNSPFLANQSNVNTGK